MNREVSKEDIDSLLHVMVNHFKEMNIHLNNNQEDELWHRIEAELNEFFEYPEYKL
jgi:hypothetical protein